MAYHHLTQSERYQIYAYRRADFSIRETAGAMGRSPATISRELRRNRNLRGYRPKMAQRLADRRARRARTHVRIGPRQWRGVAALLRRQWSPKQIARRARLEGTLQISHEWIYQYIAADRVAGGQLWQQLRRSNLRRRRYHNGGRQGSRIRFRVGIEKRPTQVEDRDELGHWEGDTILGCRRRGAAVTVVERKSRYVRIGALPRLQAWAVAKIIHNRLQRFSARVKTITLDNGTEFAMHGRMARDLTADIYFAEPYKSWQRGTNENTNGLIRQYLPKKSPMDHLTQAQADHIERRLNHRPRKCLGYLTPHEVFNDTRETLTVALRG